MFGMMNGYGAGGGVFAFHAFVSLLWLLIWTVNSVLVGWLLWVLIKKFSKK
ncbi:hypothetical protein IT087_04430 [Candidatus Uhrbacteria bacterium]|nr:hypothetical protein [Candidatus Uhrbacteria bacterium]